MKALSELQYKILDSLLFVEPFDTLLTETKGRQGEVADDLKTLIDQGSVVVMEYDSEKGDYRRSFIYDSDNMRAFFYVITKQGMDRLEAFQRGRR